MKQRYCYDLIILGGGPAGMTAAIYAAKANLKTIILEKDITGGLVNSTWLVENYPGFQSIHGMELMKTMRAHVDSLAIDVEEVCEIERLNLKKTEKMIETDEAVYCASAIILCTGRKPIPLNIEKECDQIHYCSICDGGPYKGKRIVVVGGGNSGFDESLYLLHLGVGYIFIIEATERYYAAQSSQDALLQSGKAQGFKSTQIVDVHLRDGKVQSVLLENVNTGDRQQIEVEGIFVFLGQKPNNELFKDVISLDNQGYIVAGLDMSTNVPGVYSAGDINQKMYRQITTAIADGTIAALSVQRYIKN
ncbi:MAG: NAD(P)/FAD-dependent oxidoreductase [Desulfopila sp.]